MELIWLQLIFFRLVIKPGKKSISGLRRKLKVSYFLFTAVFRVLGAGMSFIHCCLYNSLVLPWDTHLMHGQNQKLPKQGI